MKRIILFFVVITFSISCAKDVKTEKKTKVNNVEKKADKPILALANFNGEAAKWVDKEVQVKGIVDHVCKHGGKKLLLVSDEGDVHVVSETRFDDTLIGDEITLTGIVKEFKVDEAYCLQKEEDHLQTHKEGTDSDEIYAKKMEQLKIYRDSMKVAGVDHLSFYSLDYVSHQINN